MGLEENKKRKHLIKIIKNHLELSKSVMEYFKASADTRKGKLVCGKSIKKIDDALIHLNQIEHIEILDYLYASFVGNNPIAYSVSGDIVNSQVLKDYDTETGIVAFRELLENQRKEREEKEKAKIEYQQAVEKAKQSGQTVEMVWDKKTGKPRPMVVKTENNNA